MIIKEKDCVIFYCDEDNIELVQIKKNEKTTNKKGIFLHNDIIGKEYGRKIYDVSEKNYIYILKKSPELIALSLKRKTQVLFEQDIAFICLLCNAVPNKRIVEAGTGTGCLTYALANAVSPKGKVYTFEYNKERYDEVTKQFKLFPNIKKNIHFYHKNVINTEWPDIISDIDSVFLDLPNPWLCVEKVKQVLKERGIFVTFLPCIEQVQKIVDSLEAASFCEIVTYELLQKSWSVLQNKDVRKCTGGEYSLTLEEENKKKENKEIGMEQNGSATNDVKKIPFSNATSSSYRLYQKENKTHTGYITVARKMLNDEKDQMELDCKIVIN